MHYFFTILLVISFCAHASELTHLNSVRSDGQKDMYCLDDLLSNFIDIVIQDTLGTHHTLTARDIQNARVNLYRAVQEGNVQDVEIILFQLKNFSHKIEF